MGELGPKLLPCGLALAPADAANCVLDVARTDAFQCGIRLAIEEVRRAVAPQCVEVVYAGTGPYAPLVIPLLAEFRPDEVRCTFIDVHPENLHSVERLLSRLGLEDYVRALWLGDAATYRHPSHLPLHIVVVETMQAALAKEPQVAITRNLVPQLHPLGALVPERIVVELAFADPRALREGLVVGRAAELTRHSIVAPHSLLMPPRPPRVVPVYLTGVQTYGPHSIPQGASGLTSPVVVAELMNVAAGERVRFDYEVGANPRLVANVVRC